MTPTSAWRSAIQLTPAWSRRLTPARTPIRQLSTSPTRSRARDVLAKYRPRPPLVIAREPAGTGSGSTSLSDEFVTSSTQPVGTSFQTVPPPTSDAAQHGEYAKTPVPAMISSESIIPPPEVDSGVGVSKAQRRKEMIVQGVPVPPKPIPPGEEDCCMSGCVHCVYTIYADDLELYTDALESARQALTKAQIPVAQWPDEVQTKSDGAEQVRGDELKKVEESVDPSMAAFLALEAKMRKKQVA